MNDRIQYEIEKDAERRNMRMNTDDKVEAFLIDTWLDADDGKIIYPMRIKKLLALIRCYREANKQWAHYERLEHGQPGEACASEEKAKEIVDG